MGITCRPYRLSGRLVHSPGRLRHCLRGDNRLRRCTLLCGLHGLLIISLNPLHDRGYESIGDTHSTVPGAGREGRWAGTDRVECGLHVEETA